MPNSNQNKNQGQGQGQGRQNGGAPAPAATAQGVRDQVQQTAADAANRLREGYGTASEAAAHQYRQAEGAIARNPGPSVLIGFGVGLAFGLALTTLLIESREETWGEKAERLGRDAMGRGRDALDRGRSAWDDAQPHLQKARRRVEKEAPDMIHSLTETLRDLPAALSRYLPGR